MPGKIFVNYRRDDVRDMAARVRDRLAPTFGHSNVFMDVDNLMAGQRFDRELEKALAETDVFLAVIGPRWMDLYQARQASGERDYVHEEIAGALKRGITVIPILIEGANLPRADALPEDIRDLVLHHKQDVRHEHFGQNVVALVEAIKFARRSARPPKMTLRSKMGALALLLAACVAAAFAGAYYSGVSLPWSSPPKEDRRTRAVGAVQAAVTKADDERKRIVAAAARLRAEAEARLKGDDAERQRIAVLKAEEDRQRGVAQAKRKADEEAARRAPQPGQVFRDCDDGCPEMVVVPAGEFMMGSNDHDDEKPIHKVTIRQPFAVGKVEVTFAEWDACVSAGGCKHKPEDRGWGRGRQPVINVSWGDVVEEYIPWLSRKAGKTYRLLTEAEWEYAARGVTNASARSTKYPWGDDIGKGNANCDGCGSQWDYKQTAPAGSFKANPFGLHDMHGNVYEWVQDCYQNTYNGAPTDGSARSTSSCSSRVLRGGSWHIDPQGLRSAIRFYFQPDGRVYSFGFRVSRTLLGPSP